MERHQHRAVAPVHCLRHISDQQIFDPQAQRCYFQLNHHLSCRLDCAVELERLTQQVFRQTAVINPGPTDELDVLLLPIATDLLRKRWLAADGHAATHSIGTDQFAPSARPDVLHDQATRLYIKLRAFRNNPIIATETCAAIHQWIGKNPLRQAAYDQVRRVWCRKGEYEAEPHAGVGASIQSAGLGMPSPRYMQPLNKPASLGWPDVVLLVFVFLLLLPIIYFLSVPAG